jgi:small neutral amino acid transporter SnatA (MarC family)
MKLNANCGWKVLVTCVAAGAFAVGCLSEEEAPDEGITTTGESSLAAIPMTIPKAAGTTTLSATMKISGTKDFGLVT